MISERAIEKAIEGGWLPRGMKPKKKFEFEIDKHVVFFDKVNVWRMSFEAIALDPSFWQSFGEMRGWTKTKWLAHALGFSHCLLTEGDTEKFWDELLK